MFTLLNMSFSLGDAMGKRTPQSGLSSWDEVQALDEIVIDKRPAKRAGRAKARRRDRRYENRLLRTTLETMDDSESSLAANEKPDPSNSYRAR